MMGKAAAAGYGETIGIGRPTSDQGPAGRRAIADGISVQRESNATRGGFAVTDFVLGGFAVTDFVLCF
jgi:hypothetical protein